MVERVVNGRRIRLVIGDITQQDVEAFVYDARPDLQLGAGWGNAIAVRGGPSVQKELTGLAPVKVGEAVVTSAGKLPARFIIHAVAPKFQEEHEEAKLRAATTSALVRADERGVGRLAVPALGAGFFGMPAERCARIMLEVIAAHLAGPTPLTEVVVCLLDSRQRAAFEHALARLDA